MEIIETKIKDLLVIKPDVFIDERGYFFESYNKERFAQHGLDMTFVQDNESQSMRGVLRGLHFQKPPFAQGKLVRVVKGAVMDVAVDLRKGSPTSEGSIRWNDPDLGIDWNIENPILSEKDKVSPMFKDFVTPF